MKLEKERLKIDSEPRKLRIDCEPYVKFVGKAYCPVVDVFDLKKRREYFLIISAQSLSLPLRKISEQEQKLAGIEVWVNKASDEKFAKYELELC